MSNFFAMLSRMKYIERWALMRNTRRENLSEHSLDVSVIAHLLATLCNSRFGGTVNAERAAVLGLFHDTSEILTGDMPTPVKYFNPDIKRAYHEVEDVARRRLLSMLPEDLHGGYAELLLPADADAALWIFVKAADKISALIKCIEERRMGNTEFLEAERTLLETIQRMNRPEVDCFLTEFLPAFSLTLDQLESGHTPRENGEENETCESVTQAKGRFE